MALKTLFNEVEFLTNYPMVGLAITDSSGPVPGYLFGEINAITYVDNGSHCKMLVKFLVSRLKSDTPIVCIKILKLLLYLVKNGHIEVTNELKLHEVSIKEARCFNGPADDVYGNSFYQTIRNMAKELLDVIFSENVDTSERASIADSAVLSGYGSQASSKKMAGFGYSIKTEKSVSDLVSDSFSNFMDKLFPSPDKETEPFAVSHIGDALPKYKPLIIDKSQSFGDQAAILDSSVHSLPTTAPKPERKVKAHRPGRAGGGWESSSEEEDNATPPLIIELNKESTTSAESLESSKGFVECVSETSEERKIIDEAIVDKPVTELKVEEIRELCRRCSSLNIEEILSLALERLSETDTNVHLAVLIFIEYLIFFDVPVDSLMKIVVPRLQKLFKDDNKKTDRVKIKAMKIIVTIQKLNEKIQNKFEKHDDLSSTQTEIGKS